jgi:hypothetical protein
MLNVNGLQNADFYGLFTAFVPTFREFYRLLSSLQTFTEFFDFECSFLLMFIFIEFIEFYEFLWQCSLIYVLFCTDFP